MHKLKQLNCIQAKHSKFDFENLTLGLWCHFFMYDFPLKFKSYEMIMFFFISWRYDHHIFLQWFLLIFFFTDWAVKFAWNLKFGWKLFVNWFPEVNFSPECHYDDPIFVIQLLPVGQASGLKFLPEYGYDGPISQLARLRDQCWCLGRPAVGIIDNSYIHIYIYIKHRDIMQTMYIRV